MHKCIGNIIRTASARMASAIERAVQRAKGERAAGVGGEMEITVPQAAVKQCYKGHRNARLVTVKTLDNFL